MNEAQILQNFTKKFDRESNPFLGNIFIDLNVMHDFKLGALLTTIDCQEALDYINWKVHDYEKDYDRNIEKHFSALDIPNKEIDRILHQPNSLTKLWAYSPPTSYYRLLEEILKNFDETNRVHEYKIPFHLHVYTDLTSDLDIHKNAFKMMLDRVKDLTYKLTFGNTPVYDLAVNELNHFDAYLLNDPRDMCKPNTNLNDYIFNQNKGLCQLYFAPPVVDTKLHTDSEHYDKYVSNAELALQLFTNFHYCRKIVAKGDVN